MNLLYLGRWNSQFYYLLIMLMWLNVMSLGQMLLALIIYCCHYGSCSYYGNHVGVRSYSVVGCYLSLSSGDLTSTSSHMCGSRYLQIFLFRDGSLTLINIASFDSPGNNLVLPAHYVEIVPDSWWPVMLWWSWMGDGTLMCSLSISANVLPDSPMYSSSQLTLPNLYL